jgi:hypothetical protein
MVVHMYNPNRIVFRASPGKSVRPNPKEKIKKKKNSKLAGDETQW